MKSFLFISSLFVLFGCSNDSTQSKILHKETNRDAIADVKVGLNAAYRPNYPNTEYLQPGIYKGEAYFRADDDLEESFLADTWLGIFKTKQNWYLLPVKPQIETVFDGIVDDTEADTANWSGKIMRSTDPSYEYGPNRLECLFVGLIDADAIPDLIISSNFDGRILYLSGEAKEQRIVEPVFYEPMTGGC